MHSPTTFAGIDWATRLHAVCVVDERGAILERYEVEHSEAGLRDLIDRLRARHVDGVAIERPDGPVIEALLEARLTVVVIAGRHVKALRSRYGLAGNRMWRRWSSPISRTPRRSCARSSGTSSPGRGRG